MIFLIFLPVIIALVIVMARKTRFYTSVLLTCGAVAVGCLIYMFAVYLTTGMDFTTFVSEFVNDTLRQNEDFTKMLYATLHGADVSAVSSEVAFASVSEMAISSLVTLIPAFFAGLSVIGGLVLYLIVRAVAKACGSNVIAIPAFSDYTLPRHFGRWSLLGYIVVLIGYLAGWSNFNIVYAVVAAFLGSIYYIQGLCFIDFLLKKKVSVPVIIIILAVITLLLYQIIMFVGIIEQVIKIRKRIAIKNNNSNGGQQ